MRESLRMFAYAIRGLINLTITPPLLQCVLAL